jgi:N-acetylglutamate synthase-like GNAT family acetyltransferase
MAEALREKIKIAAKKLGLEWFLTRSGGRYGSQPHAHRSESNTPCTTSLDCVTLEVLTPSRFPDAQAFYASVGYYGAIANDCTVFATRLDGSIIGVARLAPEQGVTVLRGMMIAEDCQRNGIGSRMLRFMEPYMGGSDVFCLPHGWLEEFYGQIGFVKIDPLKAPKHLQERLIDQKTKYPHMIIMSRRGKKL